eukprot:PITA_24680
MAFNCLRFEYALDNSLNYIAWKDRMEAVLEDNSLKDFIDQEVPKLTDATQLTKWKKCVARARKILPEGVRDHIVLSLHGKETSFSMWKTLKDLYQNNNDQRKLVLKDKLHKIKCEKGDTISTYLNKLTTCRDVLGSVGITTTDDDMEEIRRSTRDGSSSKQDDEENIALAMGHYATNHPQKKAKKGSSKGSDGEALASQFELDFSLIACMVSSIVGCVWYLDSVASFHMSSDKNIFSTLEEKDLQMQIEMGNDGEYHVSGEGTIVFQRENGATLTLTDVKYVLGLKKNLVSIAMLEDKGYDVVFSKGKVFLRHIGTGQTK